MNYFKYQLLSSKAATQVKPRQLGTRIAASIAASIAAILVPSACILIASLLLLSCDPDDTGDDDPAFQTIDIKKIAEAREIPAKSELGAYSQEVQAALAPIAGASAKPLGILYVSGQAQAEAQGGSEAQAQESQATKDGSTWQKAFDASKLKSAIEQAGADASSSKPYLIFITPGFYVISESLSMKNNVAIIGGIPSDWSLSKAQTIFDGGASTQIFNNLNLNSSAVLYGVTITNGNAKEGGGMLNTNASPSLIQLRFSYNNAIENGGGMSNSNSSPKLTQLSFLSNSANEQGGAMYISGSSPSLSQLVFSGNFSNRDGGGIYITGSNSAPKLTQVIFSGNSATHDGAGIYITGSKSSPSLKQVIFSDNITTNDGGGIYFSGSGSSPMLTQSTFFGNSAARNGGGIFYDNEGTSGAITSSAHISNSIFWDNRKSQIYIANGTGIQNLNIHNSVLQGGITALGYKDKATIAANINIVFSGLITDDPKLTNSDMDLYPGASITIPAIQKGSSAINKGLYIRESSGTFYYSTNATTWYSTLNASGLSTKATLPDDTIDLTATDITGYTRTARPDIGAYEFR